jgi:hypothetical protein
LQPKLRAASDYCYYDRLHFLIKNLDMQPLAFGFCLLQQNLLAVLSSAEAGAKLLLLWPAALADHRSTGGNP